MGKLKEFWNKTIFSDMVDNKRKKREQEEKDKTFKEQLRQEVLQESREELKQAMKAQILEEEKQKILKPKKNLLAEEFGKLGENIAKKDVGQLIGGGTMGNLGNISLMDNQPNSAANLLSGKVTTNDKISDMMSLDGVKTETKVKVGKVKQLSPEDRIKKIIK